MTAADLADLIGARKIDKRIWEDACPVCGDGRLLIEGGIRKLASVSCDNNCHIYKIVNSLRIHWHEYVANPVPPPKFSNREERDLWLAEERQRHREHGEACARRREALETRRSINQSSVPLSAYQERKLKKAIRALRDANRDEIALRAPTRGML